MEIAGYTLGFLSWGLQSLLLWRCLKIRLWQYYPYFFGYFVYVFLTNLLEDAFFLRRSPSYATVYWSAWIIGYVVAFAVAWEVLRQTFPREFPVRRIACSALVAVLCALAIVFYLIGTPSASHIITDFMRKIALSVAVWLLVVFALARYYSMPVGRNIGGMATGLFAFFSAEIVTFASIDISQAFGPVWIFVIPFCFNLMLLIWIVTLWSYVPNRKLVAPDAAALQEARLYWEENWAALGTMIRRMLKP